MEDAKRHGTIRHRDSPGAREETALGGSIGFWAVSFWLDVVTEVGRLRCAEPRVEVWTVRDCGSLFS